MAQAGVVHGRDPSILPPQDFSIFQDEFWGVLAGRDRVATGDETEELAEKLQAGTRYVSKDGGIRLHVQEGSLVGPVPDPINLHHSVQLLKAKGRDYITDTTIHCPPEVSFQDPLLLDFLLGDPAISGGKGVLQDVLQNYQVHRVPPTI